MTCFPPAGARLVFGGGTGGDRTRDPNIKSVVLYQLSYSPGVEVAYSIPNCVRARNQIFPQTRFHLFSAGLDSLMYFFMFSKSQGRVFGFRKRIWQCPAFSMRAAYGTPAAARRFVSAS